MRIIIGSLGLLLVMPAMAMAAEPSTGTLIQLSGVGFLVILTSCKVLGSKKPGSEEKGDPQGKA